MGLCCGNTKSKISSDPINNNNTKSNINSDPKNNNTTKSNINSDPKNNNSTAPIKNNNAADVVGGGGENDGGDGVTADDDSVNDGDRNSGVTDPAKPNVNPYIKMNSNDIAIYLNNLEKQHNDMKLKNKKFYDDISDKEEYISNYRDFLAEFNRQIIGLKDNLNISLSNQKYFGNLLSKEESNELSNDIENISNKIHEMELIIEKQKIEFKNLESNFKAIQEQFNENKKNTQNSQVNQNHKFSIDHRSIKRQMEQTEEIIKKLNENKEHYDQKQKEIEYDISIIQSKTDKKVTGIKTKRKKTLTSLYYKKSNNYSLTEINDSFFDKGSMLLGIRNFKEAKKILNSIYLSNNDETKNTYEEKLILKNWYETCYINDEFDTHYIYYDLKAVGLNNDMDFTSASLSFDLDNNIEINHFEIDGKPAKFDFYNNYMRFNIKLKNLESKKIHIIYKESPIYEKLTESQKVLKNIYRRKIYGLPERLVGQKGKYILVNVSSFEIINFEDEFFIKNATSGNIEYQWQGKIPENGKKTLIRLSKKEARINFHEKYTLKTIDDSFINKSSIKIIRAYWYGNNTIIKYGCRSDQYPDIKLDENKNIIKVQYIDTKSQLGEFIIKGELINRCKGEWLIKLTDEEIDNLVPPDYKTNKEQFKSIALDIIKKYNEGHRNDIVIVPDVTKIGKWVYKNVTYDSTYTGRNDITATDTLFDKKGVCHHKTKLFNALMYSLGYQVLYILGYSIGKTKSFSINDSHAWSLIKINGQWLPFDATNGIFSGKFPVTYVFKQIEDKSVEPIICYDKVEFEQIKVNGNFI